MQGQGDIRDDCNKEDRSWALLRKDLRNKVLARIDPKRCVESIMSEPVITIKEDDFLSEAFYRMLKHQIHRLAVVDDQNNLLGLLNGTDIMRFQTDTALYFIKDLEAAVSINDIKLISNKMTEYVTELFRAEISKRYKTDFLSQ
jgi:CBS domain-containing protein